MPSFSSTRSFILVTCSAIIQISFADRTNLSRSQTRDRVLTQLREAHLVVGLDVQFNFLAREGTDSVSMASV